jgi:excinuclease ABC subunit C
VASKVSFFNGQPDKSQYRRYHIRTVLGQPNDVAAMKEVLQRRLRRLSDENEPHPDLIVIDGGKPQLHTALAVRDQMGMESIPMIGLAKQNEEIFQAGQSRSLQLPLSHPGLLLLRHIRDEAHRFAIAFHRKTRQRSMALTDGTKIVDGRK